MGGRRPPVVDPDEIRDDWNTRPRKPYRGRRGANPAGRKTKPTELVEAPTEAVEPPRPWTPAKPVWPTFDLLYERVPAYSMDMVREIDLG